MTDQEALAHYTAKRDAEAFRLLVREYQLVVYAAASRRLILKEDIEDVVQTTFLKLAKAAGSIRQSLSSWLYTTAINSANDLIRRDQTRRRHEALAAPLDLFVEDTARAEWLRISAVIDEVLLELPESQQSLVVEHYLKGRTQREIAKQLGVSQPTVLRRLNSAVDELRRRLALRGYDTTTPTLGMIVANMPKPPLPETMTGELMKIGLSGMPGSPIAAPATVLAYFKVCAGIAAVIVVVITATLLRSQSNGQSPPTPTIATSQPAPLPLDPADWRGVFQRAYSLRPEQNLRFIAPPPLPERQRYLSEVEQNNSPMPFIQWRWVNGKLLRQQMRGSGPAGAGLASVITSCTKLTWEQVDAADLPTLNCDGDWIVRDEATNDAILSDLKAILREQLNINATFEKREEIKQALVAVGQYRAQRLPEATSGAVQVFSDLMDHPNPGDSIKGGGNTPPAQFWAILGQYLSIPIVDESTAEPAKINWLVSRSIEKANTEEGRKQILENLTRQTGLRFKQQPRTFVTWKLSRSR